jgi:hypothetical protein
LASPQKDRVFPLENAISHSQVLVNFPPRKSATKGAVQFVYKIMEIQYRPEEGFKLALPQVGQDIPVSSGLRVYFVCMRRRPVSEHEALEELRTRLAVQPLPWLMPGRDMWSIDLDLLAQQLPSEKRVDRPAWFTGTALIRPLFEPGYPTDIYHPDRAIWRGSTCFDIAEESLRTPMGTRQIPVELEDSLGTFMADHPNHTKTAFIMMQFGRTPAHRKITNTIKKALVPFGITALRADDKEYHPALLQNILTYIYGCKFGIAVFERIESDDFNPNVSL